MYSHVFQIFQIILQLAQSYVNNCSRKNVTMVGSILDYSFPYLNSFSENNIKKLQSLKLVWYVLVVNVKIIGENNKCEN
ncbi:hypothetical protein BpHYR1_011792 [Brachionus plicatilis]|uniref:Uncharacterized protein n=1 Tax=Brachionus plicatilis TaxID=10195 RepID=A0A3M7P4R8_BRAPC|nr:hypothetical protein BpHYR1_011792 [Brachionus plicatilis]